MAWKKIQLGDYRPDMPALQNPGSGVATNVLPRTELSYGPMPSLNSIYGAIDARCQGAFAALTSSGDGVTVCGDADKLYRLASGDTTPQDASKSGGYNTATDERWNYTFFDGTLIASNFADPIQALAVDSGTTFADLSATAPQARYLATVKDFVMVGNTFDGTDGNRPQRVWWCASGNATDWPTPGSSSAAQKQSGFNDLQGDGGWVQGIVGNLGTADAAIFQEHAVWRAVYAGPPTVFDFFPALGARGCLAPGSIVQADNIALYLGEDGFYAFDGSNALPIGFQKIDKTFFNDFDPSFKDRISAALDPVNKIAFWSYPGAQNNDGLCNRLLAYHIPLQKWSLVEVETEVLCRSLTIGYTLDGLDALGYTLDELPFSLDSRVWTGGDLQLSAFNGLHELGYFNGANMAAVIETSEQDIGSGRRMLIRNARPLVDGGTPSVALAARDQLQVAPTWSAATAMNAVGLCPQRVGGRYLRGRLTMPAGQDWTHIQGLELDVQPLGIR